MSEYKDFDISWKDFCDVCESISIMEYLDKKGITYKVRGNNAYGLDFGDGDQHDSFSIKMDQQVFNWFSQGISGKGLISFVKNVMKVNDIEDEIFSVFGRGDSRFPSHKGDSFTKGDHLDYRPKGAVLSILEQGVRGVDRYFMLPALNGKNFLAIKYLCDERKLDKEVVRFFIERGDIYECLTPTRSGKFVHNVAFLGKDKDGIPRACEIKYFKPWEREDGKVIRSISVNGSNKMYSFSHIPEGATTLRCFEATIDAMSWLSMYKMSHGDKWKKCAVLVLEGVGAKWKKVPDSLVRVLCEYPSINDVIACFDNDKVGQGAADTLMYLLSQEPDKEILDACERGEDGVYRNKYGLPILSRSYNCLSRGAAGEGCKDWNDTLKKIKEKEKKMILEGTLPPKVNGVYAKSDKSFSMEIHRPKPTVEQNPNISTEQGSFGRGFY